METSRGDYFSPGHTSKYLANAYYVGKIGALKIDFNTDYYWYGDKNRMTIKESVTGEDNIHQLVGGAGEDTILARVGEGIVSSIGSAETHEQVLENPDSISKLVLRKGLDAGTAYEILSIDIADIDVGKNIGATPQMDQANADKNIAQAKAEERRAMAVATEQEMKARAQEARAEVIQAEAEVPKALAQALREGKMGFMDYYKLENLKGDTAMREGISSSFLFTICLNQALSGDSDGSI